MPETPAPEGRTQDVPDEAVKAVAEALLRDYDAEFDASHLQWRDFAGQARRMIEAAGPHLARQVRAEVAAEQRAAAQAIETSRGEDLDPLATAIYDGCERDPEVPAMRDDCRNIAIVAYRHLADRIAAGEPDGARLALVTADDLAELLDFIVGGDDVRVVRNETLDRAFAALKATLPHGEVR